MSKSKREAMVVPTNFVLRTEPCHKLYNFDSFSLHFDLPLKAAAEKFGVRATAFKKRCRAIGIRHWPYRKVRSLKRSIKELARCKENGTITEKQRQQHMTFKQQLDRLMSPQTYGLDPSGRILHVPHSDDSSSEAGSPTHSLGSPKSPDNLDMSYLDYVHTARGGNPMMPLNDTMSPVFRKTMKHAAGMKNTSQLGLTLSCPPDLELDSVKPRAAVMMAAERCDPNAGGGVKRDEFHEALEQMDYGNEKHFLDGLFVELSPIYDCKV